MSDTQITLSLQCTLIRKGGTLVDLNGSTYHFAPNAKGDHVCEVNGHDDIARFLSMPEAYRVYSTEKAGPAKAKEPVAPPAPPAPPAPAPTAEPVKDEPKAKAAAKAKKEAPAKDEAPMGIPAAEKIEALETMTRDEVAAIFKDVVGRAPSEHAEIEVMIAQIEAKRAETAAG